MLSGCKLNSDMLITLVDDLLDLAKEEQLTFQLNKGYFNMVDSINKSFDTLKFISQSRNLTTILDVKPEDSKYFKHVFGDSHRF